MADMRPLALTMGDPAGIGPDITLRAWMGRDQSNVPPFVALTDPDLILARADALGLSPEICVLDRAAEAPDQFSRALPILPIPLSTRIEPGQPDRTAAPAIQASIEQAVDLAFGGRVRAVVTNPISKAVLYDAGFSFPGHTEYLARLAELQGHPAFPVMLLAAEELKVVPVTIHIPLSRVPDTLTTGLLLETIRVTEQGMRRYFGIERPRLALTGLNPHAGEAGAVGDEEARIIAPAIAAAQAEGLDVQGPYPADTLFQAEARAAYDVALAMYHDQALIPIKTLAFDRGVNVTLGLPFLRTSPDHGTAFAIAGTGRARPDSLIEALKLADRMSRRAGSASAEAGAASPAS